MKTKKPCPLCPQLAAERDQLLAYQKLYEKTKQHQEELQAALQRSWKLTELKNWSSQRLLAELISRELVLTQHNLIDGKQKIEGYFIWKQKLEEYDQSHEKQ